MLNDLRYALRALIHAPAVAIFSTLTLAIGIGGATTIYTILSGVALQQPPVKDDDRVARVFAVNPVSGDERGALRAVEVLQLRETTLTLGDVAAFAEQSLLLGPVDVATPISVQRVTTNYFRTLRFGLTAGRRFDERDARSAGSVVILSERTCRRLWATAGAAVGRQVLLDGQSRTVIGVMPDALWFPGRSAEAWVPLDLEDTRSAADPVLNVVARLNPSATWEQARAELATLGAQLARAYPAVRSGWSLRAAVLRDEAMKKAGLGLFALFGPAVVLLLIACSNVANLLLARATYREREVAVRAALGATRLRLVRERFAETVWIAVAAGVLGLCLAAWGVQLASVWIGNLEPDLAVPLSIALDGRACLFALAVTLVTPLLFGLFPAIQGSKSDLNGAMRAAGRRSRGRGQYSGRDLLVIVEMALAVILVVASTLFVALFWELGHFERGFDSLHVLAADLTNTDSSAASDGNFNVMLDAARALPGVTAAALSDASIPFGSRPEPIELADCANVTPRAPMQLVTGSYFATLGIHLLSGRPILDSDIATAPPVALIGETLAARCWPVSSPIGRRLRAPNYVSNRWVTVVGVFSDVVKGRAADMAPSPVYLAAAQTRSKPDTLYVRTAGDPVALIPNLRRALRSLDPRQPLDRIDRVEDRISRAAGRGWVMVDLIGAFAVLAIVLAALGVYMVMSYAVAERTREFGIRMALGAARSDVLRLVIGRGGTITGIGAVLGGGGTIIVTRLAWSEMLGVGAGSPFVWVLVILLLAAVSLGACVMPAYRATRVDPMVTLRCE